MSKVRERLRRFGKNPADDTVGSVVWLGLAVFVVLGTDWTAFDSARVGVIGATGCMGAWVYERSVRRLERRVRHYRGALETAESMVDQVLANSIDMEQVGWLTTAGRFIPIDRTNGVVSHEVPPIGSEPLWRLPGPHSKAWKRRV